MTERNFKLSLNNHDLAEAFFEETRLLGVMAPMADYQFCWQLNNLLGMDFRINNEIEIRLQKKKRDYFFSVFDYSEPVGSLTHYIYNNQFEGEFLLPEFRHLDFLWLMKGDWVTEKALQERMNAVRAIAGVQLVLELLPEKVKNKEHLVI